MQNPKEVIDLTISLSCYIPPKKPRLVCNEIIDLSNDSFEAEKTKDTQETEKKRKDKVQVPVKETTKKKIEENVPKERLCSICWEKLGKNPLASTKCGHVYCLECLKKSLKVNQRCPTCRTLLKGATAYHPLYLDLP